MLGYQVIPEEFVNDLISIASGAYFIYAGWKNNYLSKGYKAKRSFRSK